MNDIKRWLAGLGLERFADAFEREKLTPANLPELTDDDRQEGSEVQWTRELV